MVWLERVKVSLLVLSFLDAVGMIRREKGIMSEGIW